MLSASTTAEFRYRQSVSSSHQAPPTTRTSLLAMRNATVTVLGLVIFAAAGFAMLARYLSVTNHFVLIAAALSSYFSVGAPIALVLFMMGRHWIMTAAAAALTVAAVVVQLQFFVSDPTRSDGVPIRLLTANLYLGEADAKSVVAAAEASADLLAVQELTPLAARQLSAAGIDKVFPYRKLEVREEASGTGLWSRFPIVESHALSPYNHAMISSRIRVEGVKVDPTVLVAHLSGPWPQPIDAWSRELNQLRGVLRDAAAASGAGCVVAAGDFNSTTDMRPFRALLEGGYRDAAEQTGAGITATFPANMWLPPLIAIDHVLTSRCSATSTATVKLPGTDHKGLLSVIQIPHT